MKKIYALTKSVCTIVLIVVLTSCSGVNGQKQKTSDLTGFTIINFNISGELYVTQGQEFSVKLTGSENDLGKIITRVDGTSLIIKTKNNMNSLSNVKVLVTLPELSEINLAGSGNVYADEKISAENLKLSISGSGDIRFKKVQTTNIKLSIAGSGDITAIGVNQEKLAINIAGSGDINASELKSKVVKVDISGSGSAKVWATDKLKTDIVGSGRVRYKGDPLIDAGSVGSGTTRPL